MRASFVGDVSSHVKREMLMRETRGVKDGNQNGVANRIMESDEG